MKKYLLKIIYLFPLLLPFTANAALLDGLTGENQTSDLGAFNKVIQNGANIVFTNGMVIAVIMVCVGGVLYISSSGDEKRVEKAKQTLTYAIGGFLLLILAKLIVAIFAKVLAGGSA